ncbi:DUF4135 domain-containing protein [Streptomyces sp. NPDC005438]|uniref:DUF4135 domain-containing protein n=1 Tax=Streptomyces sp. NPDC005438 TaxID=3156880 RepID=UPI0033B11E7A
MRADNEPLWRASAPAGGTEPRAGAELPPVVRRLVAAVRNGMAGELFPPVVTDGPEGTVTVDRSLSGAADADLVARALTDRRFAPLLTLLERLDSWCGTARNTYARVLAPDVLDVTNADLFGPVVSEAFVACATGRPHHTRKRVPEWGERYEAFLTLFLERLRQDLRTVPEAVNSSSKRTCWPGDPRFTGPVVALWAHGEETHNGRQRVLRLDCAGGGRVAYKPRPASGELLFTASPAPPPDGSGTASDLPDGSGRATDTPASLFDLLNHAPPASGEVRLPVLGCWRGSDPGYLWQEWIEPPAQWGTLRASGPWRLTGTVLTPREAERFWHRAGSLTAATFAFGITDMIGSNLVTGSRPGESEPLLYPIDLEIYFCRVPRLYDTGLLHDPTAEVDQHHVGLEATARWCSAEGPAVCWRTGPTGELGLHRRHRSYARDETRTVVADTEGRTGYGPYLPAMLRGMFDAWTLMCRQRAAISAHLAATAGDHWVRVLRQPTYRYFDALVPRWLSGGGAAPVPAEPDVRFDRAELAQLRRMDVPYFARSLDGGPVVEVEPPPERFTVRPVAARPEPEGGWPPLPHLLRAENLDLAGLGVALRDAVEHVFDDVPRLDVTDKAAGVRLRLHSPGEGEVAFDWPRAGRRITYLWNREKVRVRVDPVNAPEEPAEPAPAGEVRRRLLRLDQLDGAIRTPWAEGGMVDTAAERRLRTLTDAGIAWLAEVVDRHGWPGRRMVGAEAAGAASRLVQHAREHLEFRQRCLELMRECAAGGDLPWRDVAYLTDELRLAEGQPQWYGTRFEPVNGRLVPCPIAEPERVDHRRARMGMEPLADHIERVRQRFPLAGSEAEAS